MINEGETGDDLDLGSLAGSDDDSDDDDDDDDDNDDDNDQELARGCQGRAWTPRGSSMSHPLTRRPSTG